MRLPPPSLSTEKVHGGDRQRFMKGSVDFAADKLSFWNLTARNRHSLGAARQASRVL